MVAPAVPAAMIVAAPHPDAELLALGVDLDRVEAQSANLPRDADFAKFEALTEKGSAIAKRMLVIRPTTLEGHHAKAKAFVWCADEMPEDDYFGTTTDARMAVAIIRDLLEFGGAA
ncbi:hypothetical protein VY88_10585 [Azospirillum thiophilum]|uniref:Uncharacterized protein n=2 Tax=Azospirillum thiophilum TaxID=528244 RepID=A0AAC8VV98_9PROT|nr:hypothetical protein AL072_02125 [Azospirillum thiophilum]KJR66396.1 hypothetical protein VY88_10585 [Azospirillum thiophilum]